MIINIMFSFIKFSNRTENSYDIRFPLNELDKVVSEDGLNFKFSEKIYFLKNVVLRINPDGRFYNYENDININIKDGYIIREYDVFDCKPFSFHNADIEEEYELYENQDSSIKLKKFDEYFTIEKISSNGLKII